VPALKPTVDEFALPEVMANPPDGIVQVVLVTAPLHVAESVDVVELPA
jgi:hypothetical protein